MLFCCLLLLSLLFLSGCQTCFPDFQMESHGFHENIVSLSEVIFNNPYSPSPYNVRGVVYGRNGDYQKALKDFDKALQLNPSFYAAYANRALIYRYMRNGESAFLDYNRALQINPYYAAAYIGRGSIYQDMGLLDQAIKDYTRAIQLETSDGDGQAWYRRALIKQQCGYHEGALADFGAAMSRQPYTYIFYNGRGVSYIALEEWENAIDDFKASIRLNPNLSESWFKLAYIYEKINDGSKAYEAYSRAWSIDRKHVGAKDGMQRTHAFSGYS